MTQTMITQFHARKTPNLLRTLPNRHPEKENYSNRRVADVLGCVPQTINNEIKRGTVTA